MLNFMNKVLLSSICSASFMLTGVNATELDARSCDHSHHHHSHHDFHFDPVFAGFRDNNDQTLPSGGIIQFNITDTNVGDGIALDSKGHFHVSSSGYYLIDYGINTTDAPVLLLVTETGVNLVLVRGGSPSIQDQIANVPSSSSIILFLQAGDIVYVQAQTSGVVLNQTDSTVYTNTSFITFLKLFVPAV